MGALAVLRFVSSSQVEGRHAIPRDDAVPLREA